KPRQASRAKLSYKDQHALETLPDEIAALEDKISRAEAALADPELYARDPERFEKLTAALGRLSATKETKETEWLELEMKREEMSSSAAND
ncbi:MAG: ABC transporter C-terminal domain-containing protein, partial [Pseudomonadota bacterium]